MSKHIKHWIIEGIDILGKSSLIKNIIAQYGYHHVIHYSKPIKSIVYENDFQYQFNSFEYGFDLLNKYTIPIIFDRFHLGESVYSNIYRGYDGNYVFELEKKYKTHNMNHVNLILLTTSDFSFQQDDGDSFDWTKRFEEQERFIKSFNKSVLPNKIMIDVHNGNGNYKTFNSIMNEVVSFNKGLIF